MEAGQKVNQISAEILLLQTFHPETGKTATQFTDTQACRTCRLQGCFNTCSIFFHMALRVEDAMVEGALRSPVHKRAPLMANNCIRLPEVQANHD